MKTIALLLSIIMGTSTSMPISWHFGELYPTTVKIINVDVENDYVDAVDANDNIWSWYGVEDWEVDDLASLIMYDNQTPEIKDDIIVSAKYSGYVD